MAEKPKARADVDFEMLVRAAKNAGFYDGMLAAQRVIIAAFPDNAVSAYRIVRELVKEKPPAS